MQAIRKHKGRRIHGDCEKKHRSRKVRKHRIVYLSANKQGRIDGFQRGKADGFAQGRANAIKVPKIMWPLPNLNIRLLLYNGVRTL